MLGLGGVAKVWKPPAPPPKKKYCNTQNDTWTAIFLAPTKHSRVWLFLHHQSAATTSWIPTTKSVSIKGLQIYVLIRSMSMMDSHVHTCSVLKIRSKSVAPRSKACVNHKGWDTNNKNNNKQPSSLSSGSPLGVNPAFPRWDWEEESSPSSQRSSSPKCTSHSQAPFHWWKSVRPRLNFPWPARVWDSFDLGSPPDREKSGTFKRRCPDLATTEGSMQPKGAKSRFNTKRCSDPD